MKDTRSEKQNDCQGLISLIKEIIEWNCEKGKHKNYNLTVIKFMFLSFSRPAFK